MRKLCKAELTVLKRYGFLEEAEIEEAEYNDILNKIPYYAFSKNGNYYKYVVPQNVTDDLIEQLERAEMLDLEIENNENLKSIKKNVDFFKMWAVIYLILIGIALFVVIINPILNFLTP